MDSISHSLGASTVIYRCSDKRLVTIWGLGISGALLGAVAGYLVVQAWIRYLSGRLDWPFWEFGLFHLILVAPFGMILAGGSYCTAVFAHESGLTLKTCYVLSFDVPWGDVIAIRDFSDLSSESGCAVSLIGGLTCMHHGLPVKGVRGWQWPRGFALYSDSQGYSDLIHTIKQQIGSRSDLR